eukprot:5662662-Pleurochrysis_carterae.AAC.1
MLRPVNQSVLQFGASLSICSYAHSAHPSSRAIFAARQASRVFPARHVSRAPFPADFLHDSAHMRASSGGARKKFLSAMKARRRRRKKKMNVRAACKEQKKPRRAAIGPQAARLGLSRAARQATRCAAPGAWRASNFVRRGESDPLPSGGVRVSESDLVKRAYGGSQFGQACVRAAAPPTTRRYLATRS